MKTESNFEKDELRPEYDLDYSKAEWGKYAKRLREEGSNIVMIDPDLSKQFPNSNDVNDALRTYLKITDFVRRTQQGANK